VSAHWIAGLCSHSFLMISNHLVKVDFFLKRWCIECGIVFSLWYMYEILLFFLIQNDQSLKRVKCRSALLCVVTPVG
jgi:hypothetical protein